MNNTWPAYSEKEIEKISKILRSGKVNYWTGKECRKFEKEFAEFTGTKYAVALANGTLALELALKAIGIKKSDEVIVTSRTFLASVSSIIELGAKPVFADVDKNTQNLDVTEIRKKITTKTKAIMCVHLAGWPNEMDEILKISKEYKLKVIEDCAQAHGAIYKNKSVGGIGDIGCWSFCQDKIMTTGGEGGMVTTNNKKFWEYMWSYKDHGKSYKKMTKPAKGQGFRWVHDSFGSNYRMTEIQAAIGRNQIKQMSKWTKIRNKYQAQIWQSASRFDALRVPNFQCLSCECQTKMGCVHGAYKCYVFIKQEKLKSGWSREKIIREINLRNINCFSGSCSEVYLEKAFHDSKFKPKHRLKNAKELGDSSLMFLVHPTLSQQDIDATCNALSEVMHLAAK